MVDRNGRVRFGIKREDDKIRFFKKSQDGSWVSESEIKLDMEGKSYINQKIHFLDFGYDENIIYIASSIGSNRWRILKYNLEKKAVVDTVLQDNKYDIGNPIDNNTKLLFLNLRFKN